MRIYIIHSPRFTENYIDRIIQTEKELIKDGHHVMNPLPDQMQGIGELELHKMYASKIKDCDAVFAMEGWDKTDIGNCEMSEAIILRKTITFEQKV